MKKKPEEKWRGLLDAHEVKCIEPAEHFSKHLAGLLAIYILPEMGWVRESKMMKLVSDLYATAHQIADMENRLTFARKSVRGVRALREKYGRTLGHVRHSLDSLTKARTLLGKMEELKRGWLDFSGPERGLKRLEQNLAELESTCAALIHPGGKTDTEEGLAVLTPYMLEHLPFPITEGSAALQYHLVKMLDEQLQAFTRGKVLPNKIEKFISKFCEKFLGWYVTEANAKTMRRRVLKAQAQGRTRGAEQTKSRP